MHREEPPDAIGLSAIDLISCAFIAVLLLNLMLDEGEHPSETKKALSIIRFELPQSVIPGRIGVRVSVKGHLYSSWEGVSPASIRWLESPGSTVVAVESEAVKGAIWEICLLDSPPTDAKSNEITNLVKLRIRSTQGRSNTVDLKAEKLYRARISL
jgi:hypothetical protein